MHKPCTLEMVHVRLQAVRQDHFGKVVAELPSGGPIVITGPYEHVRHHSSCCWSILVFDAHWGHVSACDVSGPCVSTMSCWSRVGCVNHVSCVHHADRLTCVSSAGHISRPGHADRLCMHKSHTLHTVGGPSEVAGGPRGPLWRNYIGVAI